jgi:hypothetical protein
MQMTFGLEGVKALVQYYLSSQNAYIKLIKIFQNKFLQIITEVPHKNITSAVSSVSRLFGLLSGDVSWHLR